MIKSASLVILAEGFKNVSINERNFIVTVTVYGSDIIIFKQIYGLISFTDTHLPY